MNDPRRRGGTVLDAACGTGRALPPLRAAVGLSGHVLGVDVTAEMLTTATRRGRHRTAQLVLADVVRLPVGTNRIDAVFAAGLLAHLEDPEAGLAELARVCRPGGRLALFHPLGRVALARRHGSTPTRATSGPNPRSAGRSPTPAGGASASTTAPTVTSSWPFGRPRPPLYRTDIDVNVDKC